MWKSKFYGAFVLNRRVFLHAIDATVAQAPLTEKLHPEKRHFILADEMGLGKTVEALAAAELRRAVPWAIGYGAAPRAVAVVAPNAGVLDCVEIKILRRVRAECTRRTG